MLVSVSTWSQPTNVAIKIYKRSKRQSNKKFSLSATIYLNSMEIFVDFPSFINARRFSKRLLKCAIALLVIYIC